MNNYLQSLLFKILTLSILLTIPIQAQLIKTPTEIDADSFITVAYENKGVSIKKVELTVTTQATYANLSLYAEETLLVDDIDIPSAGTHKYTLLCDFVDIHKTTLKIKARRGKVIIEYLKITDSKDISLPIFVDISKKAGLEDAKSIKYGGPTIADIDNDGYYDFIVNNHNEEPNKLYWNNGDGTVQKHPTHLSKWYRHDLHGSTAADFDNDGDLDIVVALGGGNGTAPIPPLFYLNDNGKLILTTGDVGITKGARGRAARWSDMDQDGDLDLILINAASIVETDFPQHLFYKNNGDGTFQDVRVDQIENTNAERILVTDFTNDHIDDIVLFSPLSFWKGNGNFSFTNVNSQFPETIINTNQVTGATDIDIDNDGDLDLYLSRGKVFGVGEIPSLDYDVNTEQLDIKIRGVKGVTKMDFKGKQTINFFNYNNSRRKFKAAYPIYLGASKQKKSIKAKDSLSINAEEAKGWPSQMTENGIYFGYTKEKKWKVAIVRNDYIFWNLNFSISNVEEVTPDFIPGNRNVDDILLQNNKGSFTDVSTEWNILKGGDHQGVSVADFNNDGREDLFIHRWGFLASHPTDYMLLNTGKGFMATTAHRAIDPNDEGHGDMGQAFDFDLDGDIDVLNGSDDIGKWYLYENNSMTKGNYALVRVNYAPKSHIDPMAAVVTLTTDTKVYRKRVGSSGEVFSQSLLNTIHFGLGKEKNIKQIKITWRNGETMFFKNKNANQLYDTNKVDPTNIEISNITEKIRKGTSIQLSARIAPDHADKTIIWSSSDPSIATITKNGVITALQANKSVTVTAHSTANTVQGKLKIKTTSFFPKPLTSIAINSNTTELIVNDVLQLTTTLVPENADQQSFQWTSTDDKIASVDTSGKITALAEGNVTIKVTSVDTSSISAEFKIKILPFIKPSVNFDSESKYKTILIDEKEIKVTVNYDAGTNGKILMSNHGGVKVWLREFTKDWIFVKDVTRVDKTAVGKRSGTSEISVPLKNIVPSEKLKKGNFYILQASFVANDGVTYSKSINHVVLK